MANIAIVYHSGRQHTEVQALAVAKGAASVQGAVVSVVKVEEIDGKWPLLDEADAIIFGSPTYFGSASSQVKAFMEKTGDQWHAQSWDGKLAAGFTNSGAHNGDKLNTLIQLFLFAMQHGMQWIGLGLLPGNNTAGGTAEDLNRLGCFMGAMAQSHIDLGSEIVPPKSDRETAEYLGRRVALAAAARRRNAHPAAEKVEALAI